MYDNMTPKDVYKILRRDRPEVYNPSLDIQQEWHEVMVGCLCNRQYVIRVNAKYHEVDDRLDDLDVVCPFCQRPISKWVSASKHSGGFFNAVHQRRVIED